MSEETKPVDDVWAIVELMGHVRLAGRLTEEEKFGGKLGRLDIPQSNPCWHCEGTGQKAFMAAEPCETCNGAKVVSGFITQFFGASSVYRITIVTEQVARHTTKQTTPAPVSPWDYPKQLIGKRAEDDGPNIDPDDEDYGREKPF